MPQSPVSRPRRAQQRSRGCPASRQAASRQASKKAILQAGAGHTRTAGLAVAVGVAELPLEALNLIVQRIPLLAQHAQLSHVSLQGWVGAHSWHSVRRAGSGKTAESEQPLLLPSLLLHVLPVLLPDSPCTPPAPPALNQAPAPPAACATPAPFCCAGHRQRWGRQRTTPAAGAQGGACIGQCQFHKFCTLHPASVPLLATSGVSVPLRLPLPTAWVARCPTWLPLEMSSILCKSTK